jgi:LmbE family N-acetylglucosaminyl deacetylase
MLIAPHPDDEAVACSIILHRALLKGATVRVVYVTDGDNNPWPQRLLERKWGLNAADRKRWGKLRRAEALAALRVLGLRHDDAEFLALPDQGMTDLLLADGNSLVTRVARLMAEWRPTDVLLPSLSDTHPDHSAVAVLLRLALEDQRAGEAPIRQWSYLVHGRRAAFAQSALALAQSKSETARKILAIRCHETQIKLSRRRFLAYADRQEQFAPVAPIRPGTGVGAIRSTHRGDSTLCLSLRLQIKPWLAPENAVLLLGRTIAGELQSFRVRMPVRSGPVDMVDGGTGDQVGVAHFRGHAFSGKFFLPTELFSPSQNLFVKFDRRSWFFDEAGWLEVPPAVSREQIPQPALTAEESSLAIR